MVWVTACAPVLQELLATAYVVQTFCLQITNKEEINVWGWGVGDGGTARFPPPQKKKNDVSESLESTGQKYTTNVFDKINIFEKLRCRLQIKKIL